MRVWHTGRDGSVHASHTMKELQLSIVKNLVNREKIHSWPIFQKAVAKRETRRFIHMVEYSPDYYTARAGIPVVLRLLS